MTRWRRRPRQVAARRGQSLVELALLLPVLALIVLGTVDLGRAFFAYERLVNAAREGALFGVHYPAQLTATSTTTPSSADPYNVVYRVRQESASASGTADPDLGITVTSDGNSDVRCYAGRSTTPLATGSFAGDCSTAKSGDTIQVRASYAFRPLTTQLVGIVGASFRMRATARMVIQ
jgi:Flp pilus assembly protein TadG